MSSWVRSSRVKSSRVKSSTGVRGVGALLALSLVGCVEEAEPDVSYEVTVTGVTNGCTSDTSGYRETFQYDLFFDGGAVLIQVDGTPMATGEITGCNIEYETSVWLEERDNDTTLRWQLTGDAQYQGLAGGCVEDPFDWEGTETITVLESTDPAVLVDCSYTMTTTGSLL